LLAALLAVLVLLAVLGLPAVLVLFALHVAALVLSPVGHVLPGAAGPTGLSPAPTLPLLAAHPAIVRKVLLAAPLVVTALPVVLAALLDALSLLLPHLVLPAPPLVPPVPFVPLLVLPVLVVVSRRVVVVGVRRALPPLSFLFVRLSAPVPGSVVL
jgi:hypothetical protein